MDKPFSKIEITIHEQPILKGMLEITSDDYNFLYSSPIYGMSGLQSEFSQEDERKDVRLRRLCEIIEVATREIGELIESE